MVRSLALIAALGTSSLASAEIVLGVGGGFSIDGSTVHTSDIEIGPVDGTPLENLGIEVRLFGLQHSLLGDLVVTLRHVESGASTTLFANVGQPASLFGSPARLDGVYAFNDAALGFSSPNPNFWAAADAAGSGVVPNAFYYATGFGSDAFVSLNAAFAGVTSAGTWRLEIEDTFPAVDGGSLMKWAIQLTGTPVPAPGVVALLGLAGLVGSRRR